MKAYLIITGTIFALLAAAHVLRTIAEWSRLTTDPWFILVGPGIGVAAGALCFWACRLLRAGWHDPKMAASRMESAGDEPK